MSFRNISAWAIRNPVPPLVLFAALMLAGVVSFLRMDINQNPDISFPMVRSSVLSRWWAACSPVARRPPQRGRVGRSRSRLRSVLWGCASLARGVSRQAVALGSSSCEDHDRNPTA